MGFDVETLKKDIQDVFANMQSDSDMALKLSIAVKNFGESGEIETIDTGKISAGTFTGKGNGKITLQNTLMFPLIITACTAMTTMLEGGDEVLATGISTGIQTMTSAGIVETDVSGIAINESGASSPVSGKAKGAITCVNSGLTKSLIECFNKMKDVKTLYSKDGMNFFLDEELTESFAIPEKAKNDECAEDKAKGIKIYTCKYDDEYFTESMAKAVYSYYIAGQVNTTGQGDFSGSVGMGTIS